MRGANRSDRPGVRPAVAMEHRQRPQIHAVGLEPKRERVAERIEVCAAMVIDDSFRVSGRPRRVEQAHRIPFVIGTGPQERGISLREQRLVCQTSQWLAHRR